MDETEILIGFAQISITLVGFAGVVAAFTRPRDGAMPDYLRFRMFNLVGLGFFVVLAALIPIGFHELGIARDLVWRSAGVIYFGLFLFFVVFTVPRFRRILREAPGKLSTWAAVVMYSLAGVILLLNCAIFLGVQPDINAGLYIWAMIANLIMPAISFLLMVLGSRT